MNDPGPSSPFLVGREAELARIRSAVDDVAQRGGTVRIAGDPGVGKSALLRAGLDLASARGYTALSVRATEGETHLAFAALYQLLRPMLGRIDELPAGHRAALMSAFGLAEPGDASANRFFIGLAALELLADAAAETPVLVGVDDLSWLDDDSREAIEFISRRITDEQIVMVTTCRLNQPPESTYGSYLLWLDALDAEASRELLHHQAPNLSAADEGRVLQAAAGNPLALLELAKVVGRTGESSLLPSIPLTQRLERSFAVRLDDLDPRTRTALLVAAVQGSDQLSETSAALARLTGGHEDHDARADLRQAAGLGMLIIDGDTFRFRHPLVQSAIAQSALARSEERPTRRSRPRSATRIARSGIGRWRLRARRSPWPQNWTPEPTAPRPAAPRAWRWSGCGAPPNSPRMTTIGVTGSFVRPRWPSSSGGTKPSPS
jgi:predicted ATPase